MRFRPRRTLLAVLLAFPLMSGCDALTGILPGLPGFNAIVVEVVNDTAFEIDPRIRFAGDTGFFAGLFGGETLATGILPPGEALSFRFDCDALGLIRSESAGQFIGADPVGQADVTRALVRDDDFACGDIITFTFLGEGPGFRVVVSVNDLIVD